MVLIHYFFQSSKKPNLRSMYQSWLKTTHVASSPRRKTKTSPIETQQSSQTLIIRSSANTQEIHDFLSFSVSSSPEHRGSRYVTRATASSLLLQIRPSPMLWNTFFEVWKIRILLISTNITLEKVLNLEPANLREETPELPQLETYRQVCFR